MRYTEYWTSDSPVKQGLYSYELSKLRAKPRMTVVLQNIEFIEFPSLSKISEYGWFCRFFSIT